MKIKSNHSPIKQLLTLLFFIIPCTYLASCGLKTKSSGNGKFREQPLSLEPPSKYHLADPQCQQSNAKLSLDSTNVWHWDGPNVVNSPKPLRNTNSDGSLNSNIISETSYGMHIRKICHSPDLNEGACVDENQELSQFYLQKNAQPLKVCRNDFNYPRDSYEGVALTSIHYVNSAADTYRRIMNENLPKVSLQIMPLYETLYLGVKTKAGPPRNISLWMTDNLAYSPMSQSILVFPQRAASADRDDKFWESSFVLAHELGHHIEFAKFDHIFHSVGLKWSQQFHRFVEADSTYEMESLSGFSRTSSIFSTISEAFADIIAFYAGRGEVHSLANLTCLGRNRNIRNAFFADNTPKELNTRVLDELFQKISPKGYTCNDVNFSDPHLSGAVLAYVLYQVFEIAVPDENGLDIDGRMSEKVSDERYRRSIRWVGSYLQKLKEIRLKSSEVTDIQLFEPMVHAIDQSIDGLNLSKAQQTQVCEKVSKLLPIFSEEQLRPVCR